MQAGEVSRIYCRQSRVESRTYAKTANERECHNILSCYLHSNLCKHYLAAVYAKSRL